MGLTIMDQDCRADYITQHPTTKLERILRLWASSYRFAGDVKHPIRTSCDIEGAINLDKVANIEIESEQIPSESRYDTRKQDGKDMTVIPVLRFEKDGVSGRYRCNDLTDMLTLNGTMRLVLSEDETSVPREVYVHRGNDGKKSVALEYHADISEYTTTGLRFSRKERKKQDGTKETYFTLDDKGNYELKTRTRIQSCVERYKDYILVNTQNDNEVYFAPGTAFSAVTDPAVRVEIADKKSKDGKTFSISQLRSKLEETYKKIISKNQKIQRKEST